MYQFVRLCPLQFSMTRLQIIFILRISWDELLLPYQSLVMLPKFNFQKVRSATHRHVVWTHVEDLYTQGYGFSSSHVWMWELDYKESWALKNWCFWTVVLEKTLENPLDCKEIQPVHPKGDQSWCSLEGLMLKLKLQYFGHLMWRADSFEKTLMLGKIEGRRRRGWQDEMVEGPHQLNGHEFGWTPGVGDWQGGLACCGSWCRKE